MKGEEGCCYSLLAVLVLLAVGGEALGLQELGGGSPLAEGALVLVQEPLLLLQRRLLVGVEALELLEATLQLEDRSAATPEFRQQFLFGDI